MGLPALRVPGALLDYGTRTYRPPAELVEFLIARDRTCRYPTCSRPARLSDIDHAEPHDNTGHRNGGATSAHNCGALCRRNHRQKTGGNTTLISHPDGSTTWTTATGHTHYQPAIDHCPEHTAHLAKVRAEAAAADVAPEADGEADAYAYSEAVERHDDDVVEQLHNAHESAASAHDADADEADRDEPHSDTSSGIDPPPPF